MIDFNIKCTGCGACVESCPKGAIRHKKVYGEYSYPFVQKGLCIDCNLCQQVCQLSNFSKTLIQRDSYVYKLAKRDNTLSSSGGYCYDVSKRFLHSKGVVYCVVWDTKGKTACYKRILNVEDLELARGSKYVKCDPSQHFNQIKCDLNCGQNVLFIGLPCEVTGLLLYLRHKYPNLTTIALLCGGGVSKILLNKYWEDLEAKLSEQISYFNFRDKKYGAKVLCTSAINSLNQKKYIKSNLNYYMSIEGSAFVRPSCHYCALTPQVIDADIVVGDCFEIDRSDGVTGVLIKKKGNINEIFTANLEENNLFRVSSRAINNVSSKRSNLQLPDYDDFFALADTNLKMAVKRYIVNRYTLKQKLYYYLPYRFKKILGSKK